MDLATWRKKHPGKLAELARAVGVRWQTLREIEIGKRTPFPKTAVAIEAATGGAVTAAELLGLGPASRRVLRRVRSRRKRPVAA